jgi:Arylsulfotransferase (ASST)/Dockerin type I domain
MRRGHSIFKMSICTCFLVFSILITTSDAQDHTVGLFENDTASFQGYTLFNPISSDITYLIDNYGRLIHSWQSVYKPRLMAYLLEDGSVLRTTRIIEGNNTYGGVEKIAWDGTVEWSFPYHGDDFNQHHDIEQLPNGNVLILATEDIPEDTAYAHGRDPSLLMDSVLSPEYIVEIQPTGPTSGIVVWEWHLWDHIIQDFDPTKLNYGVIADHPELMDLNYVNNNAADWVHANAIMYNPDLDQIVICLRHINEFWIIDHSTTTEEAASHTGGNNGKGGDLLYRWGNPQVYDAGTEDDRRLYYQHDAQWIPSGYPGEGNILVFNNGTTRPGGNYSSVDEIITSVDSTGHYILPAAGVAHEPAEAVWTYRAYPVFDFYSGNISGAQRLPNGNTLVCSGRQPRFFEVTPADEIVWEYINPISDNQPLNQGDPLSPSTQSVFRCLRFSPDFIGFAGRDLAPGSPIELYNITFSSLIHFPAEPSTSDSIIFTVNIEGNNPLVSAELYLDTGSGFTALTMYDDGLHHDGMPTDDLFGAVIAPLPTLTEARYYAGAEDNTSYFLTDPFIAPETSYSFIVGGTEYICGDANTDATVNVSDAVWIINYVFVGGDPPAPLESGDSNCDGTCNVSDAVWIINYVFVGGNEPCDTDGDDIPDC